MLTLFLKKRFLAAEVEISSFKLYLRDQAAALNSEGASWYHANLSHRQYTFDNSKTLRATFCTLLLFCLATPFLDMAGPGSANLGTVVEAWLPAPVSMNPTSSPKRRCHRCGKKRRYHDKAEHSRQEKWSGKCERIREEENAPSNCQPGDAAAGRERAELQAAPKYLLPPRIGICRHCGKRKSSNRHENSTVHSVTPKKVLEVLEAPKDTFSGCQNDLITCLQKVSDAQKSAGISRVPNLSCNVKRENSSCRGPSTKPSNQDERKRVSEAEAEVWKSRRDHAADSHCCTKCSKRRNEVFAGNLDLEQDTLEIWTKELLELVNETRLENGSPTLRLDKALTEAARFHTYDQARRGLISHEGSDGSRLGDRVHRQGYDFRYAAENVAAGQKNPTHVHASFMKSPGHAKNVLNQKKKEIGIFVCRGIDGRLYWTEEFGTRKMKSG